VHGLEAEYFGKVDFYFLDADDPATQEFQRQLGFNYQPEFYLLDSSGTVIKKWIGYVSADDLRTEFDKLTVQ
jgi:hypothetical protein